MKNGQPSRILDIRYFVGEKPSYLKGLEAAVAYGRRLALYLNGEGLSLGSYNSLYLSFSPSMTPGDIRLTDDGGDWWQRYAYVGVAEGFPDVDDAEEIALRGTVAALKTIRPDADKLIDEADRVVRLHGGELRFLIKSKSYKRYILRVATTIAVFPAPSMMCVSIEDKESGAFAELEPIPTTFYDQTFEDAPSIGIRDVEIEAAPGGALTARWSRRLRPDGVNALPARQKPCYSKLVKRR